MYLNTLFGGGLSGNLEAQARNISGAGLPFFTSGPLTTWWKSENNDLCFIVLRSKLFLPLLVAIANGIFCLWRCRINRSTPRTIFLFCFII